MSIKLKNFDFAKENPKNEEHRNDLYYNPFEADPSDILLEAINKYIFTKNDKMIDSIVLAIEYIIPEHDYNSVTLFIHKSLANRNVSQQSFSIGNSASPEVNLRWFGTKAFKGEKAWVSNKEVMELIMHYLAGNYISSIYLCQGNGFSMGNSLRIIYVMFEDKSKLNNSAIGLVENEYVLLDDKNNFGKRRRSHRPSVAIPYKIKKLAKKYKIKTTFKRNGKRVPKSLKLIKKQIKNKMK